MKKQESIKVVMKKVGEAAAIVEIPNTLESLQAEVGGYIEVVSVGMGILMICDEEGKFNGKLPNFGLGNDTIMGDVFFTKSVGEDFGSLDDKEAQTVINWLG